jgi:hypothetical protein
MAEASAKIARIANATCRLCLAISAGLLAGATFGVLLSSTASQENLWINGFLVMGVGLAALACISWVIEGLALN